MRTFTFGFIFFAIGLITSHYLYLFIGIHSVLASSIVGLAGAIIFYKKHGFHQFAQAMIFCGSFAGMSNMERLPHWYHFFIMSFIAGGLAWLFKNRFNGLGGKLGASAFICVVVTGAVLWPF